MSASLTSQERSDVLSALEAAGDVLRCDFSALAAKVRAGGEPETVWVVEIEQQGEWGSVESVHRTEAGARENAKAWEKRARSGQRVHVTVVELRP